MRQHRSTTRAQAHDIRAKLQVMIASTCSCPCSKRDHQDRTWTATKSAPGTGASVTISMRFTNSSSRVAGPPLGRWRAEYQGAVLWMERVQVAAAACSCSWFEEEKRAQGRRPHPMSQQTRTCCGEPDQNEYLMHKSGLNS